MKNKIKEIKDAIAAKQVELEACWKKMVSLQTRVSVLSKEKDDLEGKLSNILIHQKKKPSWEWVLEESGIGCDMSRHHYCEKRLEEIGLGHSCYLPEIQQKIIQVSIIKGDAKSLQKTKNGLKIILPHIKTASKGVSSGYKYIGIFEHTLSAGGSYYLLINDKEIKLNINNRTILSFKDLDESLKYIQENHYYGIKGE